METKTTQMAHGSRRSVSNARFWGGLFGLLVFLVLAGAARAIAFSSPTNPILPGDITTTEILDGTIVGADFNQSTSATTTNFGVRHLTATGTIAASGLIVGTSTHGTLVATTSIRSFGTLRVDGATTLNGVAYTWPAADGSAGAG